eukprot:CAMPEP_0196664396 /NCGR_PEP_ID=MMETSP1086-20130531/57005_1 /TAXON_ID=77921 /ORGANISM="Cyanoptyche  gloeocystis , Strain SAG4.97" /LENGTH=61 /DNA_ID=CAMNT_0042000679 /DNA_START=70 /DNA_END=255 /DNA_ORIENTATION=-
MGLTSMALSVGVGAGLMYMVYSGQMSDRTIDAAKRFKESAIDLSESLFQDIVKQIPASKKN